MNGPEAIKIARQRGFTGVIIGVTGHTMDKDVARFIAQGASLVLSKPLRLEQLRSGVLAAFAARE
jgi:CheY-like chemotaxis protein